LSLLLSALKRKDFLIHGSIGGLFMGILFSWSVCILFIMGEAGYSESDSATVGLYS